MKKIYKIVVPLIFTFLLSFGVSHAVTIFTVGQGGTGVGTITGLIKGNGTSPFSAASSGTDYQAPITLTTTGTSGAATFVANTLNIPQYSGNPGTVTNVASADGSITVTNPTTTVDLSVVKSPILTTGRTIAITGDLTYTSPSFNGSANVTAAGTLATVNSNVGSFTNASITVNGKGLITAASSGTAPVTSVSGTTNRITSTGGATPVIDISASYVGQSSITTLGTVTTGVWNGTAIANANLANSTISGIALGSSLNALTATNTSLTFSGSYDGSTARTVGLNLSNANIWVGQQTFSTTAPKFTTITGSTQCLHVDTTGLISGTGSDCGSGSGGLTVGTTAITSGTDTRILYDNAGILGEYTITGSGTVVAMKTSPVFVTPVLGAATYTTLSGGNITDSGLTSGRLTFASTGGLLVDDSDMTFATDTLTVTKIAATTFTGNITLSTKNIVTDTTTGTQIGTGSTQKLGFFGTTPVVQQTGDISTALSNLGLVTSGTLGISSVTGLGTGVATFLGTPSSANLASVLTDETGTGLTVFGTAPTFASTITIGTASGTTGLINLNGTTSGTVGLTVAAAAGTYTFTLPTTGGSSGQFLQTNGSGTTTWAAATGTAFPVQDITLGTGTSPNNNQQVMTSNATGTVLYLAQDYGGTTVTIWRLLKDTTTSDYYVTNSTTLSLSGTSGVFGMAIVGSNLYVNAQSAAAGILRRYSATDLSGVTTMTISGTNVFGNGTMWSDGTSLFVYASADTFRTYSISGTTATSVTTISFTSSGTPSIAAVSDGTNVWISNTNVVGTAMNIRKYPVAGGSVTSTTSPVFFQNAYFTAPNSAAGGLFLGSSSVLGIGQFYTSLNPTSALGSMIHLLGITLP